MNEANDEITCTLHHKRRASKFCRQHSTSAVTRLQYSEKRALRRNSEQNRNAVFFKKKHFQVNNGVVYLDYEDSHHHGSLLCSFQLLC